MKGLLIDLEQAEPDPTRHRELREVLTLRLPQEVGGLGGITLDYTHFLDWSAGIVRRYWDFAILSPQGTPWNMYNGQALVSLPRLAADLKAMILEHNLPTLGICGGHQFMAMAFGGQVGFIDPRLEASPTERYPKDAAAERGLVTLETLADDPIFAGITKHPGTFRVIQSHHEEVKLVPDPFVNLAKSAISEVQLIRIPGKLVYGMAFHPERAWEEPHNGKKILANFFEMVSIHSRAVK